MNEWLTPKTHKRMSQCKLLPFVFSARQNGEFADAARSAGQRRIHVTGPDAARQNGEFADAARQNGEFVDAACSVAPQRVQLGMRSSQTTDSYYRRASNSRCFRCWPHFESEQKIISWSNRQPDAHSDLDFLAHGSSNELQCFCARTMSSRAG